MENTAYQIAEDETIKMIQEEEKEIAFPNFPPNTHCRKRLKEEQSHIKPHRIAFYILLAAFMVFFILTMALFLAESISTPLGENGNYTGAIICSIFCGLTVIIGIVNLVYSKKYEKQIIALTTAISINEQYAAFIEQGYEEKEAYKLTLEWIDRKEMKQAVRQAGTAVASSVLLSQFLNK